MGFYTHISVTFSPCDKEPLSRLAEKMLDEIGSGLTREAEWFLQDCVTGRGYVSGPKGALYTWGLVGNYTDAEEFVKCLMPFWDLLIGKTEDCCFSHDRVCVFYEPEQSEAAQCFEIWRDNKTDEDYYENTGKIIVRHHENLPFCWGQY